MWTFGIILFALYSHFAVCGYSFIKTSPSTFSVKTTDFLNKLKQDLRRNNDDYLDKNFNNNYRKRNHIKGFKKRIHRQREIGIGLPANADKINIINITVANKTNVVQQTVKPVTLDIWNRTKSTTPETVWVAEPQEVTLDFNRIIHQNVHMLIPNTTAKPIELPESFEPSSDQLDMAPARGGSIYNLRLRRRLCHRHVLLPEGPKYDSEGSIYVGEHNNKLGHFTHTKKPRLLLPKCCNCCKKSVLGCE